MIGEEELGIPLSASIQHRLLLSIKVTPTSWPTTGEIADLLLTVIASVVEAMVAATAQGPETLAAIGNEATVATVATVATKTIAAVAIAHVTTTKIPIKTAVTETEPVTMTETETEIGTAMLT